MKPADSGDRLHAPRAEEPVRPRLEAVAPPKTTQAPVAATPVRTPTPDGRPALPPFSIPVFVSAAAAGLAGHFIPGPVGIGVALVVAAFGAVAVALLAGGHEDAPAVLTPEPSRDTSRDRERLEQVSRELERAKRHVEMATTHLRDGKDPLTEVPELRVGPLRELLQAAKEGTALPVVSRLPMTEAELVAADGEPLPVPWPKDADVIPTVAPPPAETRAIAARELAALVVGLESLAASLRTPDAEGAAGAPAARTPAQLVDAVVHTAADGIEDLAAGLMRANELASVAERVTNKATLLALNAALEATRSGSEAFAAIAEETRRLAEFAREATDTIGRLSGEIEYKVGETITAIHAASEDAKSGVAAFRAAPADGSPPPPVAAAEVEALLARARELKRRLGE